MGRIPIELRAAIARNIRDCRMKKFPGRGGGKKCAEAFGVSPQQWSPWERASRTPDEERLKQIADFFEVTVEWLRRDHTQPSPQKSNPMPSPSAPGAPPGLAVLDFPPPPSWEPAPPGSTASFFWLARHLAACVGHNGIRIDVNINSQSLEFLARLLKNS